MNSIDLKDLELERSRAAYAHLAGKVCRACESRKEPKMSFCGFDYHNLPKPMQVALYDRAHYVENYYAALAWLKARKWERLSAPLRKATFLENRFHRWVIVHPILKNQAWSGSRWVSHKEGLPAGDTQISNFAARDHAEEYVAGFLETMDRVIAEEQAIAKAKGSAE